MPEEDQDPYIGKRMLVGLSYFDSLGELMEQTQVHGEIVRIEEGRLFLERADGKGELELPFDPDHMEPGQGEYTLNSTGEVVVDPDFVSVWKLLAPKMK